MDRDNCAGMQALKTERAAIHLGMQDPTRTQPAIASELDALTAVITDIDQLVMQIGNNAGSLTPPSQAKGLNQANGGTDAYIHRLAYTRGRLGDIRDRLYEISQVV